MAYFNLVLNQTLLPSKVLGAMLATLVATPFAQALTVSTEALFPEIPDLYSERSYPVPEEMLTLFNITHDNLAKRDTDSVDSASLTIYQCGPYSDFVKATCDNHNNLVTWCTIPRNSRRTRVFNQPGAPRIASYFYCRNLLCWPGYLSLDPEKAACVSTDRTVRRHVPI